MIYHSADPVDDFLRWDADCREQEKKYPVCDCCHELITDETYTETVYRGKILRLHDSCVYSQYTDHYSDFIRGREVMQI